MISQLIIIPHGETVWNNLGKLQGHLDSPLTKKGTCQAKSAAEKLKTFNFSVIYSSDLGRAKKTAKIISGLNGKHFHISPDLRERKLGIFQGMTIKEAKGSIPEEYEMFFNKDPKYAVKNSDSMLHHYNTSVGFLNKISQKYAGETIVVVTHYGVLDNFYRYVNKIPLDLRHSFNSSQCSLNIFSYNNGRWKLGSTIDKGKEITCCDSGKKCIKWLINGKTHDRIIYTGWVLEIDSHHYFDGCDYYYWPVKYCPFCGTKLEKE